jgi:hypothetical protein
MFNLHGNFFRLQLLDGLDEDFCEAVSPMTKLKMTAEVLTDTLLCLRIKYTLQLSAFLFR